jgi:hypothetical protein
MREHLSSGKKVSLRKIAKNDCNVGWERLENEVFKLGISDASQKTPPGKAGFFLPCR